MSQNRNTNVTQTFIVEAIDDATFSACTGIYTNAIDSCFGGVIYIGSDISSVGSYSGDDIYANTFYSGGTNLINIINNASVFLTGGTYSNGTLTLNDNKNTNININGFNYLDVPFSNHTGDTSIHFLVSDINLSDIGNSAHTHTIGEVIDLQNSLDDKYDITGGTINGDIYANSFYSGTTNLSSIISNSSIYLTGATYSNGTLTLIDNKNTNINVNGFNYLDIPFSSHTGDTSIHFTKSSITLSNIGNSAHTHTIGEIVNLQNSLDNKFNVTGGTISGDVTANYFYGDGSNLTNIIKRNEATKTTNDNGLYTIDSITGITSDTTRFIEVYVTAHLDINNYGFWKRTIGVMNIGGVSTVMIENYDTDKQSSGLNPTDVTFSGSGSNISIQISGELSKTYNWTSDWEIIKR